MRGNKYIQRFKMSKLIFIGLVFSISCIFAKEPVSTKETQINASDFIEQLALHDAVSNRDLELVKFLIKEKSNLNLLDKYGYTPLHIAVRLNELEIVKTLINAGAKVNTIDSYKDTPLIDSTRNDYTEMSELLICNGALRDVQDMDFATPLHNASRNKNKYISKMLRAKNLIPYCENLGLNITDLKIENLNKTVCGDVIFGIQTRGSMSITDNGKYNMKTDSKKWCSTINRTLSDGVYDIEPFAKDIYDRNASTNGKLSIADDMTHLWISDRFKIQMDDVDYVADKNQKICGDIKNGNAKTIDVTITNKKTRKKYGVYKATIDNKKRRWCADVKDSLDTGVFAIKAYGVDNKKRVSIAHDNIYRLSKVLGVNIDNLDIVNKEKYLCGKIYQGVSPKGELYGVGKKYPMSISKTMSWCSKLQKDIKDGVYPLSVKLTDTDDRDASSDAKLEIKNDITNLWIDDRFKISLLDVDITEDNKPKICGKVNYGDISSIIVEIDPKRKNSISYEVNMFTANNSWCVDTNTTLPLGNHTIKAYGKSKNGMISVSVDDRFFIKEKTLLSIGFDDHKVFDTPKPKLCGDIISDSVENIEVKLEDFEKNKYGPFEAKLDKNRKRWCIAMEEQIPNSKYVATAIGDDNKGHFAKANDEFIVDFNWGLYEALKREFKDDFGPWDAELDKDSLTFRFKKPEVLFEVGKGDLKENFQGILDNFFPRYLKVLQDYKDEIQEVRIEGHTSSRWGSANSEQERYNKNLNLSQKRADEVREFVLEEEKSKLFDDSKWVDKTFKGYGMSFDDRIYYPDGKENYGASRRVEFEIVRKIPENKKYE